MVSGQKNLTRGNPASALVAFAMPFLGANLLQALYGAVDLLIVGKFGGGSAGVAAVAGGGEVMHLLMSFIMGLSTGATVLIGKRFGAHDSNGTGKCIGLSLSLGVGLSVLLTLFMLPLCPSLVCWLRTPGPAEAPTLSYLLICSAGIVFIVGYNILSAIFRGFGNSAVPLICVGIACVVNVIGDLIFVALFDWGVAGAALATVLSQALSMAGTLFYLFRGNFGFRFQRRSFTLEWELIREFFHIGLPVAIQGVLISISFICIFAIVNTMGVAAAAGYGIVNRINGFAMLPAGSFAMAMAAITAQNMGAGKYRRAIHTLKLALVYTMSFGVLALAGIQMFPRFFISCFIDVNASGAEEAILQGIRYARSFSLEYILVPIVFCTNGFFNGCGRTFFSMMNNLAGTFLVRVPVSFLFGLLPGATLVSVGLAAPLASFCSNVVALIYLRSGRWKPKHAQKK